MNLRSSAVSAPNESEPKEPAKQEVEEQQQQPNASPAAEDDESDAGKYMLFDRSDDEVDANNQEDQEDSEHHVIPKSPDELWKRSASMRGGRGGGRVSNGPVSRQKYSPPLSIGMPSWGSMEEHGHEDYASAAAEGNAGNGGGEGNVITPAIKGRLSSQIHPNMFRYPPSSPIKASPPSKSPVQDNTNEALPYYGPEFEEAGEEWIPPPTTARARPSGNIIKTARLSAPITFPGGQPSIKPQFVRETGRGSSKNTPPRQHPSLVVDASTSHDSAETPGRSLVGRVQVVGVENSVAGGSAEAPWSLVSQSRSIESGEEASWGPPLEGGPDRRYHPYPAGTPYRPPPTPYRYAPPPPGYPPERYDREGLWSPYPPPRYEYGSGYPYPPPPSSHPKVNEEDADPTAHPLLKDYNPNNDRIRPQFQNTKKTSRFVNESAASNAGETGITPRKRRRRNPEEKLASAAAMAAAAAAAAARAKMRKVGDLDEAEDEEDEIKTVGSVEDEDIPAAKRAAMASAVALRAAAGGSPLAPPKSAAEVDFDITDPPLTPVHPPSTTAILESASQMSENDVLCGRGGGTNSQMGNRRYRALVRDFQPTYLMARRREKPLMARSVVLIVRHRGGRFLRRDDTDGRLYEVGDEKAEAKTSQALREGLDVRATKTAANTLMGTETSKKKKRPAPPPAAVTTATAPKAETAAKPPAAKEGQKGAEQPPPAKPVHVPTHPPYYAPPDRPGSHGPPHHHPYPPPPRYDDPYYRSYPPHYPPGAPPPGYYPPYPPPPGYGPYGAYPTPPRSGEHPPPPGSHAREPNPFSPPRRNARNPPPLTPVQSRKEGEAARP